MIAVGCDHGGFDLMQEVKVFLDSKGIEYKDFGCYNKNAVDYPDIAKDVCAHVVNGEFEKALLFCGTGIGISIAANKVKGIRAAACIDYFSAKHTRLHNNANVLCLGGRVIGAGLACELVDVFLNTDFEGERHQTRIDKITLIEDNN
ncbi:MAG: sugar-phosphate isomerase, RpiB/LacA/LacB family [Oscillospiraceae bacterium]|jgi:ribose 5-phosphate isomerase B|nr:sugar-phosphate isomerase, RpiB/LacA/LacB family [Oscillospiraceae bacterium]